MFAMLKIRLRKGTAFTKYPAMFAKFALDLSASEGVGGWGGGGSGQPNE